MKQWIDDLKRHYQAWTTTRLAQFWLATRSDGALFGWVDHDRDITVDGQLFRASLGFAPTATQTTTDMQPGTLDVTSFMDVTTEEEIEAGVWDEAEILVFEAPWDVPPGRIGNDTTNVLLRGRLGQITRKSGVFTAQLHSLLEQLDTRIGEVYTPTCPWRLGDERCQVDLTPFTHTGTVTNLGADPRFNFVDDTMDPQDIAYFNEGTLTFLTGRNAGRTGDVRAYGEGNFTMHRPFPYKVELGDTFSAVRGDDKRLETCRDVFHNTIHFRGFPYIPGADQVLNNPAVHNTISGSIITP